MLVASKLFEPFVTGMGIVTPEEYERVYEQMQLEIIADDFRSLSFMLTIIGTRP